jgi:hypothetical protein
MMTNNNEKEERFSELLSSVEKGKILPDKQFLDQLRDKSAKEFEVFAAESKTNSKTTISIWRTIMKSRITKFAAAAAIIVAVVIGISHFGISIDGTNIAFADVLQQIRKATSVTYTETLQVEGQKSFSIEKMVSGSGILRSSTKDFVTLCDFHDGRDLTLWPATKKAILVHRTGEPQKRLLFDYLDWVSKLHENASKFTGQEKIDGKTTNVFVIDEPYRKVTIWVDIQTDLPAQVKWVNLRNPNKNIVMPQIALSLKDFGGQEDWISTVTLSGSGGIQENEIMVMSNFVWNEPIDESLFNMAPPEGYTVEDQTFDVAESSENNLVEAFKFWTEISNGQFPSKVSDFADPNIVKPMLIKKFKKGNDPSQDLKDAMQAANKLLKALVFAQDQMVNDTWGYTGNGIRLGDANAPICSWKLQNPINYRILYGDLSIHDSVEKPNGN